MSARRFWSRLASNSSMGTRSTPPVPRFFLTLVNARIIIGQSILPVNEWCLMGKGLGIILRYLMDIGSESRPGPALAKSVS